MNQGKPIKKSELIENTKNQVHNLKKVEKVPEQKAGKINKSG